MVIWIYLLFYFSESLMATFMICNMIGLSSTITNPILYGYLNQNIQEVLMQSVFDLTDKFVEYMNGFNVSF